MKTEQMLEAAKKRAGLPSDYALAARLGVTRQRVSSWRGGVVPDPSIGFKLAGLLGEDPARIVADLELERAERKGDDKLAQEWRSEIRERWGTRPFPASGAGEQLSVMSTDSRRERMLRAALGRAIRQTRAS